MVHYELKPMKLKTFYRLIPTLMFIIAITTIVLTMFFMFVLQSRNAYELDNEEFNIDNDDFKMEIIGATSDQIANLDIDNINFEDDTNTFTTPQSTQFETFLLKKTLNPTTNNHIKTNNNLRNMKAYKIVSKEPIIENSLVKIVMAPHNVLEKLSKHDHDNVKYALDKIDRSGNAPVKEHSLDGELIQNGNGNVNLQVFSLEEEGNVGFMADTETKKNLMHQNLNNIQVIAKSHNRPLNMISIDRKIPFNLKAKKGNNADKNRGENESFNKFQSVDVEKKSMEIVPEMESSNVNIPTTTEEIVIDPAYSEAEELLSNPTTSRNLVPTLIPENVESEEDIVVTTEINEKSPQASFKDLGNPLKAPPEVSTETSVPLVVLKILKNRTLLIEESDSKLTPDQLGVETTTIPKTQSPIVRPKKITRPTTTTKAPLAVEVKQSPKKTGLVDSYSKYKNAIPKFDDVSFEITTKTSLSDVETTHLPSLSETGAKSKNMKRAVGDEGTFSSNIVRPSPLRPKTFADLLPRETDAEREERLTKSMQRIMHFANIVGHVDSYLTRRFRNGLKNVAKIFDSVENSRRRRSNL